MSELVNYIEHLDKPADILNKESAYYHFVNSQAAQSSDTQNIYSKDTLEINSKDTKFLFRNSSRINIQQQKVYETDPRLRILKYIFEVFYGINIDESVKDYEEAKVKYLSKKQDKEKISVSDSSITISGIGIIENDKAEKTSFEYSIELDKLSEFASGLDTEKVKKFINQALVLKTDAKNLNLNTKTEIFSKSDTPTQLFLPASASKKVSHNHNMDVISRGEWILPFFVIIQSNK